MTPNRLPHQHESQWHRSDDTPQALRAMLGREMVVVQPRDAAALEERLSRDLGVVVRRHGDELRLEETEDGASLPLLERILVAGLMGRTVANWPMPRRPRAGTRPRGRN